MIDIYLWISKLGYDPYQISDMQDWLRDNDYPPANDMMVYLDDLRDEPEGWVRTHTVEETIALLETGNVSDLSLDNDLGEGIKEGYKVLDWIEEQVYADPNFPIPARISIHSANPVARQRMLMTLQSIDKARTMIRL